MIPAWQETLRGHLRELVRQGSPSGGESQERQIVALGELNDLVQFLAAVRTDDAVALIAPLVEVEREDLLLGDAIVSGPASIASRALGELVMKGVKFKGDAPGVKEWAAFQKRFPEPDQQLANFPDLPMDVRAWRRWWKESASLYEAR
jgi:hypothetical protein